MARSISVSDISYVCVYLPPHYFVIASNVIPTFTCDHATFASFLEGTDAKRILPLTYTCERQYQHVH
eukprot:2264916-Karenia_brevis.AAC.1